MIPLSPATRVFVVTGATDMRKGFDGLYGIVANRLGPEAWRWTEFDPGLPMDAM